MASVDLPGGQAVTDWNLRRLAGPCRMVVALGRTVWMLCRVEVWRGFLRPTGRPVAWQPILVPTRPL